MSDYGCHWCGADPGQPCRDDCPSWDDPPLLCHCPPNTPTGSLTTCTVACQQLGAELDLEDL